MKLNDLHTVFELNIPENGFWLMLGYLSLLVESMYLEENKEWIVHAAQVVGIAGQKGITNFWVQPPSWLTTYAKEYPISFKESGLYYPPCQPLLPEITVVLADLETQLLRFVGEKDSIF